MTYAVIRSGGKQYTVHEGERLRVERLAGEAGDAVEINEVLLIGGDGDTRVGTPHVTGARVVAEIVDHGKAKKIIVGTYKAKVRTRRRNGHRQQYTQLAIKQIVTG